MICLWAWFRTTAIFLSWVSGGGVFATAELIAIDITGEEAKADGQQHCSFHSDFSRVGVCSRSTRWMVARDAFPCRAFQYFKMGAPITLSV